MKKLSTAITLSSVIFLVLVVSELTTKHATVKAVVLPSHDMNSSNVFHQQYNSEVQENSPPSKKHKVSTNTEGREEKSTETKDPIDILDLASILTVVNNIGLKDSSILNLRSASKKWKNFMDDSNLSQYSVIGSSSRPISSQSLCTKLSENENLQLHIRNLHVTKSIWDRCGFDKMPKLKNLKDVSVTFDNISRQDQAMIDTWESIHSTFPNLNTLQVYNHYHDNILHILLFSNDFKGINRLNMIKEKLDTGLINVNEKNNGGNTPLHYCMLPDMNMIRPGTYFRTVDCINMFLHFKSNPNEPNKSMFTPVHIAASLEYKDPLETLVSKGGDINSHFQSEKSEIEHIWNIGTFENTETPLHIAIKLDTTPNMDDQNLFLRKSLLADERHINMFNSEDVLFWLHRRTLSSYVKNLPFTYLLEQGADMSVQFGRYGTPLNEAIVEGKYDFAMKMLESESINMSIIESPDTDGQTPLILAAKDESIHVFEKLVALGANVNAKDKEGRSLLHISAIRQPDNMDWFNLLTSTLRLDINSVDNDNSNVLHYVARRKGPSVVLFMDMGNQPENENEEAIKAKKFTVFNFLTKNGINLHERNREGISGLFLLLNHILDELERNSNDEKALSLLDNITDNLDFLGKSKISTEENGFTGIQNGLDVDPHGLNAEMEFPHIDIPDAHLLVFTVFKYGTQKMIEKLRQNLPKAVMVHFERPVVNEEGLVFSPQFKEQKMNVYSYLNDHSRLYHTISYLIKKSPSISKLIHEIYLRRLNYEDLNLEGKIGPSVYKHIYG